MGLVNGNFLALGAASALALGAALPRGSRAADEQSRSATTLPDYVRVLRSHRDHRPEGWGYASIEDYLFVHGVLGTTTPLLPGEADLVRAAHHRLRWRMQACYRNAQELVLRDTTGTLQYAEGYALGHACIPVLHGWVTVNGKVVDPTWFPVREGRILTPPASWHYFGAPFSRADIREIAELKPARGAGRKGQLWSILDYWEAEWPVLRRPRARDGPAR